VRAERLRQLLRLAGDHFDEQHVAILLCRELDKLREEPATGGAVRRGELHGHQTSLGTTGGLGGRSACLYRICAASARAGTEAASVCVSGESIRTLRLFGESAGPKHSCVYEASESGRTSGAKKYSRAEPLGAKAQELDAREKQRFA